MIGTTVSHYRILEKLGEGGMGVVYKAQDTKLDRLVALKFLPPHLATNEKDKQRFIHEAKAASALNHPNICDIHEIDKTPDGQLFIVMALYDGIHLDKKIEQAPLKIEEALDIAVQAAEGLQAAHEKGIVHRDIKTSNIIVTEKGRVVIMDFGLARTVEATKLTKTGTTLGTVPYMSPEQARGEKVDHRSDIWSLGAVIYEMVTGQLPFKSQYNEAIVYSILNENPPPVTALRSGVPMELERIVKKSLEKNPSDRYQHADELIVDLRRAKTELGKEVPSQKIPITMRFQWRSWYLVAGAGMVVAVLLLILLPRFTTQSEVISSIAVLPLENLSGDPEQEYFVDGMTDALISDLAKIKALRVISRTSIMQYKKARKPLPEIAKELNVAAVVEGTVMRSGGRVRITAQLIEAATDKHLWSESYERNMTDILTLQSEIARAIAKEVKVTLTPQEETRLATAPTVNKEAYELYLKGRYHLEKWSEDGTKVALEYFERAVSKDSMFAQAYAGVADCYLVGPRIPLPSKEAIARGRVYALKALDLDSTLAEAHTSLAIVKFQGDWNFSGAEIEFKRAFELNANYAHAFHFYSHYLLAMSRINESFTASMRYLELEPLSPSSNLHLGNHYLSAHQYDLSIEQLRKTLAMDPNYVRAHVLLAESYEQKGMYDEAVEAHLKAKVLSGDDANRISELRKAYSRSGIKGYWRKLLNMALERSNRTHVDPLNVASLYARLDIKDKTFEWLNKAYDQRSDGLVYLNDGSTFDNIRSDVRFQALLKKMGLQVPETDKGSSLPSIEKSKTEASSKWQYSIAVLPFKNISSDKEQEYFCDGITEQLITNLTNLPNVKVIARTSVMQFKNTDKTIQQIANELGVAHVLEGSVRKAGGKIRVTAQLIKADDGFHLWAKDYDRQLKDIFAVQDDVSSAIVDALKINLTGGQKAVVTKRYTENVEAYQLYLKGRYHWYKRSEEGLKKSIEYFDEAIRLDPKYALAYSGLADAYGLLEDFGFLHPIQAIPKAKVAATKALELDETLPEAHTSLGFIKRKFDWDWTGAEREFKRAIELNPNYVLAHHWYAHYLAYVKRHEEALAEIRKALRIDPLSLSVNRSVGHVLYLARQYPQSVEQLRKTLEMDNSFPLSHVDLHDVYEQQGLYDSAVEEYLEAMTLRGKKDKEIAALKEAYKISGWRGFCRQNLEFALESSKKGYVPPYNIAAAYVRLGEKDSALVWLQKALEAGSSSMTWLKAMPIWDSLRSDPRFIELLKKVRLEK